MTAESAAGAARTRTGTNQRTGQALAVVVGAGAGGMAVARRLGNGHRVLLADRDAGHLERQVACLRSEGHDAGGVVCDVVDPVAVWALAAAGPVKALAHVVGLSPSMADGPTILRVNLIGPTLIADAFLDLAGTGTAAPVKVPLPSNSVRCQDGLGAHVPPTCAAGPRTRYCTGWSASISPAWLG